MGSRADLLAFIEEYKKSTLSKLDEQLLDSFLSLSRDQKKSFELPFSIYTQLKGIHYEFPGANAALKDAKAGEISLPIDDPKYAFAYSSQEKMRLDFGDSTTVTVEQRKTKESLPTLTIPSRAGFDTEPAYDKSIERMAELYVSMHHGCIPSTIKIDFSNMNAKEQREFKEKFVKALLLQTAFEINNGILSIKREEFQKVYHATKHFFTAPRADIVRNIELRSVPTTSSSSGGDGSNSSIGSSTGVVSVDDVGSTRHIEIDLKSVQLKYVTADNLAVLPENNTLYVEMLAKTLGMIMMVMMIL